MVLLAPRPQVVSCCAFDPSVVLFNLFDPDFLAIRAFLWSSLHPGPQWSRVVLLTLLWSHNLLTQSSSLFTSSLSVRSCGPPCTQTPQWSRVVPLTLPWSYLIFWPRVPRYLCVPVVILAPRPPSVRSITLDTRYLFYHQARAYALGEKWQVEAVDTGYNFEEKRDNRAFQEQRALGLILELEKRSEFREQYKKDYPENKSVANVSKAGGSKWKSISDAEKATYVARAMKKKEEYYSNILACNKKSFRGR
ncbi:hypothetical protein Lal_00040083 [Lupinus albus]|nr:hypothetical protein Lal_00040083 [Lupinus albus]